MDDKHRYTTMHTQKVMKQLRKLRDQAIAAGKEYDEALSEAVSQLGGQMTASEAKYAREMEEISKGIAKICKATVATAIDVTTS